MTISSLIIHLPVYELLDEFAPQIHNESRSFFYGDSIFASGLLVQCIKFKVSRSRVGCTVTSSCGVRG